MGPVTWIVVIAVGVALGQAAFRYRKTLLAWIGVLLALVLGLAVVAVVIGVIVWMWQDANDKRLVLYGIAGLAGIFWLVSALAPHVEQLSKRWNRKRAEWRGRRNARAAIRRLGP